METNGNKMLEIVVRNAPILQRFTNKGDSEGHISYCLNTLALDTSGESRLTIAIKTDGIEEKLVFNELADLERYLAENPSCYPEFESFNPSRSVNPNLPPRSNTPNLL